MLTPKLFAIVEAFFSQLHRNDNDDEIEADPEDSSKPSAESLLEDAMKMPASMFNQKQVTYALDINIY